MCILVVLRWPVPDKCGNAVVTGHNTGALTFKGSKLLVIFDILSAFWKLG